MTGMFSKLRNAPASPKDTPPVLSVADAINEMDRVFSMVIAMQVRKERQMPGLGMSREESENLLARAKRGAQRVLAHERAGEDISRHGFVPECWKHLLDVIPADEVERFVSSTYMTPSVCTRIILSMSLDQ